MGAIKSVNGMPSRPLREERWREWARVVGGGSRREEAEGKEVNRGKPADR